LAVLRNRIAELEETSQPAVIAPDQPSSAFAPAGDDDALA